MSLKIVQKQAAEIERLREHRDHMRAVVKAAGFGSVTEALVEIDRLREQMGVDALSYAAVVRERNAAWIRNVALDARLAEAVEVVRFYERNWSQEHRVGDFHQVNAELSRDGGALARAFLAKMEGR